MANCKKDKVNSLSTLSPGGRRKLPLTLILSPRGRGKPACTGTADRGEGVSSERGVALIAAVLAVIILMVIGLSFAFNMRLEEKAAVNYMNSVRARYVAKAGIDRAVAALRVYANGYAYYCLTLFPKDFISGSIGNDTYTVTVIDTASQIYLNHDSGFSHEATRLDEMLKALRGIGPTMAKNIVIHRERLDSNIYLTKEQVKEVPGVGPVTYDKFKNDVTVHAWVNPTTRRAPVNMNTASEEVLEAVLWPLLSTPPFSSTGNHDTLAKAIIARRRGARGPFTTWKDFDDFIDAQAYYLSDAQKNVIKDNCNPNRGKTTSPAIGFTTEFSFNSGGYFEIESRGRVYGLAGDLAAESKIRAVVDIFDIWHQTTRADFSDFRMNTLRAVDATTRFYRVDYYEAAQLAHLLVETEEQDTGLYPNFNFSTTGTWESVDSGGFNANPFYLPSPGYRRRDDFANPTATCRWNFAITEAMGLSGGTYEVFAWWLISPTNSSSVTYERQIGAGAVTDLANVNQQSGGNRWNLLGSLDFPVATATPSFIGIKALTAATTLYSIADATTLAAVNAAGELYAGTMTATFSPTLSPGENVRLGTIAWTPIIPAPANTAITFDAGIAPLAWPASGKKGRLTNPAGNRLSGAGTAISYRAYFSRTARLTPPADPPKLDDVTITYLPETRILYWREVTE